MNKEIYLDNSATTKICDVALKTYLEVSEGNYGNPSSRHGRGKRAEDIMNESRATIMRSIGASDGTLVFTSCGSEANNLAIFGRAYSKERYQKGAKIITTEGEHASVDAPLDILEKKGFTIARIPTKNGRLDMDVLEKELTENTILVTMMMVNNETGALYDMGAVSKLIKRKCKDCVLHCDATQSYMKLKINVKGMGINMLTISSHKIEGPKGLGALYIDRDLIVKKGVTGMIIGGGQENRFRSGTENVPGIAAFASACEYCRENLSSHIEKMEGLRSYLASSIANDDTLCEIKPILPEKHAPHIINLTMPNIKSEVMLNHLSSMGIYVSSGSACSSHNAHISNALIAYGLSKEEADCSIRVSFSHNNEKEDVDALCEALRIGLTKLARIK
ncbi:MAG: cysteine desulfurase [Clostridia bacterium]|nr:cysteine desulfurase [Clostridia bacterium]